MPYEQGMQIVSILSLGQPSFASAIPSRCSDRSPIAGKRYLPVNSIAEISGGSTPRRSYRKAKTFDRIKGQTYGDTFEGSRYVAFTRPSDADLDRVTIHPAGSQQPSIFCGQKAPSIYLMSFRRT